MKAKIKIITAPIIIKNKVPPRNDMAFCVVRASIEIKEAIFNKIKSGECDIFMTCKRTKVNYTHFNKYLTATNSLHSGININKSDIIRFCKEIGIQIDTSDFDYYKEIFNLKGDKDVIRLCEGKDLKVPAIKVRYTVTDKEIKSMAENDLRFINLWEWYRKNR